VLAQERAIAESLGRQLARTDAPAVEASAVSGAIGRAEEELGGALSDDQRAATEAICTSGRGAELVVGVAGSGKTTMLGVVADAFERAISSPRGWPASTARSPAPKPTWGS
jgi:signal recognition particle GTPase